MKLLNTIFHTTPCFITVSPISPAGVWSCPATTGETPPPCAAFTFTAVDDKRAVMFGGNNGEQGKMNDVYLFDIPTMVICIIRKSKASTKASHGGNISAPSLKSPS